MLIDHLIYRAPDLAGAVADLEERLGVRAQAGGQHIGLGTHDALLALGPQTYLEVMRRSPRQAGCVVKSKYRVRPIVIPVVSVNGPRVRPRCRRIRR